MAPHFEHWRAILLDCTLKSPRPCGPGAGAVSADHEPGVDRLPIVQVHGCKASNVAYNQDEQTREVMSGAATRQRELPLILPVVTLRFCKLRTSCGV